MVEIYNEKLIDLLAVTSPFEQALELSVCQDTSGRTYVSGALEEEFTNVKELEKLYFRGIKSRKTAETAMNSRSSRSHLIFGISVTTIDNNVEGGVVTTGKINYVDLAGSERLQNNVNQPQ